MTKHIIVTDKPTKFLFDPDSLVMSPAKFIHNDFTLGPNFKKKIKVINLCNDFSYLSKGYYVSLLAESRGMACIPRTYDIISLNWKQNYKYNLPELNALVKKHFDEPGTEPLIRVYTTYFGRHTNQKLEPITRFLFDLFRFPVISFNLTYNADKSWKIDTIEPGTVLDFSKEQIDNFNVALSKYTGMAWNVGLKKQQEKYWIAILQNSDEKYPPSNKGALERFVKLGKKMGILVELIQKNDYASLLEYDALFIRETTEINNHTYRFAYKALQEDIPCIDDAESVIRCGNKVFLNELLVKNKIATPETIIIDKNNLKNPNLEINLPCVLKIPDGSFSRGVVKVETRDEFFVKASEMLKKSELILCQQFIKSEFDWRIGILNNQLLFASQYYMAKGHWQIYNHASKNNYHIAGRAESFSLENVPDKVLKVALDSTKLIGNGLYGVDLKETTTGEVVVIEVNDNPNIDKGIEDKVLGDEIYQRILARFVNMIEGRN